jgi:ABC-2 type transport system ATP-binding protein
MVRCTLTDVRSKLIGRLSKGYRQRVGLAQAIIHNPDVLVLDEPTAGLDPKQIIEIRDLLHALSGDHTIIVSTHILSEVEASCRHVIIIDSGRLVANDSLANLTARPRDTESVAIQIDTGDGRPGAGEVQQRLEQVPGVSRVVMNPAADGRLHFTIESLHGRQIRSEVARSIVNTGWSLSELRVLGASLEDIFLRLTGGDRSPQAQEQEKVKEEEGARK